MEYDVFISYSTANQDVAEAICESLESKGAKCFIATRDINEVDWAGTLSVSLKNSRAFVVIISQNSIHSNEVAKEITIATNVCGAIFPFRIDEAPLDERLSYHLSAFQWIMAVSPPMSKKIEELTERVLRVISCNGDNFELCKATNVNKNQLRLITKHIVPRSDFVGRTTEISEIHALFESGERNVFLSGMGGIGKTEISKAYAKQYAQEYDVIQMAVYTTDLMNMIAQDTGVTVDNLVRATASGGHGETTEEFYERKMKILNSIMNDRVLLIIDNFDTTYDEKMEEVMDLPCRKIWSTRTDFSPNGLTTIPIHKMEDKDELLKIYFSHDRNYTREEDINAVWKIIQMLDSHTYAVTLISAQAKAAHLKPSQMLEKLSSDGLNLNVRGGFNRGLNLREKHTAFEYIDMLFDFSSLSEMSINILRYMTLAPREGIDVSMFMECAEIENYAEIDDLIALHWMIMDEENDKISIHMLISEVASKRLEPSTQNCANYVRNLALRAHNAWNKPFDYNRSNEEAIYALLNKLSEPTAALFDEYELLATFCWIQGNFDLAEKIEMKLYQLSCDTYGEISLQTGDAALRVAAVYHNHADYINARPWYAKGLACLQAAEPFSRNTALAMAKVARCDAQNENYDAALEGFGKAIALYEKMIDIEKKNPGTYDMNTIYVEWHFCRLNTAKIYSISGKAEEGLAFTQAAIDYLNTREDAPALVIYAMVAHCYCLYALGRYNEAIDLINQIIEKNDFFRGKDSIDRVLYVEMLGDCYATLNDYESAARCFGEVLAIRESKFPADGKATDRIEKKYKKLHNGEYDSEGLTLLWV